MGERVINRVRVAELESVLISYFLTRKRKQNKISYLLLPAKLANA
jgi:hypothetical protein